MYKWTMVTAAGLCYMYKDKIQESLKGLALYLAQITYVDPVRAPQATWGVMDLLNNEKMIFSTGIPVIIDSKPEPTRELGEGIYILFAKELGNVVFIHFSKIKGITLASFCSSTKDWIDWLNAKCTDPADSCTMFQHLCRTSSKITWSLPVYRSQRSIDMANDKQKDFIQFYDENIAERGFLLHGPPGTGKSTTVEMIAARDEMCVHMVYLNMEGLDDATLAHNFSSVSPNSIILIEDMDDQMSRLREISRTRITNAGLWNSIDSACRLSHGTKVFITTNSIKNLRDICGGKQLLRSGRIGAQFKF